MGNVATVVILLINAAFLNTFIAKKCYANGNELIQLESAKFDNSVF